MSAPRTLMVMGAGIYQVPLIEKARQMGLRTLVVSIPGPYPGFRLADEVLYLNTRDEEGVLAAARTRHVDAIVTTGTDVAVRTIGRVCDELGLPGISHGAACKLTDKAQMKRAFWEGGVSTSAFRVVRDASEALAAAEELGFPVMMKAVDVSGSRGISKVASKEELLAAFERSRAASQADHYIVEQVAQGTEIGLEAFVWHGQVRLCLPHTKYVYRAGGTTIPVGHGFPYPCSPKVAWALREEVDKIVAATAADNCAINADLFVDEEGRVSIIEAGGRCGATTIPELVELHTGIDYYRQMIRCALGEEPELSPSRHDPCIGMLLHVDRDGTITSLDQEAIRQIAVARGARVSLDYGVGSQVHAMHNGTDRIGQIIMRTPSREDVERVAREVLAQVRIG